MTEEEKREEGKVSLRVVTKEKDAQAIQDAIREAARELAIPRDIPTLSRKGIICTIIACTEKSMQNNTPKNIQNCLV